MQTLDNETLNPNPLNPKPLNSNPYTAGRRGRHADPGKVPCTYACECVCARTHTQLAGEAGVQTLDKKTLNPKP